MKWSKPADLDLMAVAERLLIVAAAVLCIVLIWTWASRTVNQRAAADADSRTDASVRNQPPPQMAAALEQVTGRNIFSPPRPEGFQGQVVGVLGDKVFFSNDQAVGVGESVMGATVLAIGADWVEIEFEGTTQRLPIFTERGGRGGGPPSAGGWRGRGGERPMRRPMRSRE